MQTSFVYYLPLTLSVITYSYSSFLHRIYQHSSEGHCEQSVQQLQTHWDSIFMVCKCKVELLLNTTAIDYTKLSQWSWLVSIIHSVDEQGPISENGFSENTELTCWLAGFLHLTLNFLKEVSDMAHSFLGEPKTNTPQTSDRTPLGCFIIPWWLSGWASSFIWTIFSALVLLVWHIVDMLQVQNKYFVLHNISLPMAEPLKHLLYTFVVFSSHRP